MAGFLGFCQPPINGPLWIKWAFIPSEGAHQVVATLNLLPHSTIVTSLHTNRQLAALTVRSDQMSFADQIRFCLQPTRRFKFKLLNPQIQVRFSFSACMPSNSIAVALLPEKYLKIGLQLDRAGQQTLFLLYLCCKWTHDDT